MKIVPTVDLTTTTADDQSRVFGIYFVVIPTERD